MKNMNKPYVKQFDANGIVTNPIMGLGYLNDSPNRRERRFKPIPFKGNKKGISLTVSGKLKYRRDVQVITMKTGEIRRINHYVLN